VVDLLEPALLDQLSTFASPTWFFVRGFPKKLGL